MALVRRSAVTVLGLCLIVVGIALMVLPGPGILLVVAGLAVLATEYVWARKLLVDAKDRAEQAQLAAVASPLRTAGNLLVAIGSIALGNVMLLVDDVPWPVYDSLLDLAWAPVTGSILVITGLILLTSTLVTLRSVRSS